MPSTSSSISKAAADDAIKKYREASAPNLTALAKGNKSCLQKYLGAQNEHPKIFAWMLESAPQSSKENENEVRYSEYKQKNFNNGLYLRL